jgi:hypothetical protein
MKNKKGQLIRTPFYILIFLILSIPFIACKKEILDLSSENYWKVKNVLKSQNCDTKCGVKAACEGEMLKVEGLLDEENIDTLNHSIYLLDEGNDKYKLKVMVDESAANDVFEKLVGNGGKMFLAEGIMEGYDAPMNFKCERKYLLHIYDSSEIQLK